MASVHGPSSVIAVHHAPPGNLQARRRFYIDCMSVISHIEAKLWIGQMVNTISTRELCKGLSISKSRLDQWVARDLITPKMETSAGPTGRQWDKSEAIKVAAFDRLLEAGVNAARAKVALKFIHGFHDEAAILVMSTGMVGRIIPSTPIGSPASKDEDCNKVHMPGNFKFEVVRASRISEYLANPDFYASVVVNLNNIEARVNPLFEYVEE